MSILLALAVTAAGSGSSTMPNWNALANQLRADLFTSYNRLMPPPNMIKYFYNVDTEETSWPMPASLSPADRSCLIACNASICTCGSWNFGCGERAASDCSAVKVGMRVIHVVQADTSALELTIKIWYRLHWVDERLSWDPANYGGMHKIWLNSRDTTLASNDVWMPDVMPYNTREGILNTLEGVTARLEHDGTIFWSRPGALHLPCEFDGLEHFPFDEALNCSMRLGGWHHSGNYQPIEPLGLGFDFFEEQWDEAENRLSSDAVDADYSHTTRNFLLQSSS